MVPLPWFHRLRRSPVASIAGSIASHRAELIASGHTIFSPNERRKPSDAHRSRDDVQATTYVPGGLVQKVSWQPLSPWVGGFASPRRAGFCLRTGRSVYAGHDAGARFVRLDICSGSGCNGEIAFVCHLRDAASAPYRRLAHVAGKRADQLCRSARHSDDCKFTRHMGGGSATRLLSVLATVKEARQGCSPRMVGANIACGPRRGPDGCPGGELHSLPGRPGST
jgi:hypothetical protein